jgi:hypothetical protein
MPQSIATVELDVGEGSRVAGFAGVEEGTVKDRKRRVWKHANRIFGHATGPGDRVGQANQEIDADHQDGEAAAMPEFNRGFTPEALCTHDSGREDEPNEQAERDEIRKDVRL